MFILTLVELSRLLLQFNSRFDYFTNFELFIWTVLHVAESSSLCYFYLIWTHSICLVNFWTHVGYILESSQHDVSKFIILVLKCLLIISINHWLICVGKKYVGNLVGNVQAERFHHQFDCMIFSLLLACLLEGKWLDAMFLKDFYYNIAELIVTNCTKINSDSDVSFLNILYSNGGFRMNFTIVFDHNIVVNSVHFWLIFKS